MQLTQLFYKTFDWCTSLKLTPKGLAEACAFTFIFFCVTVAYEINYLNKHLPSRPAEKTFLTWSSQYPDQIRVCLNHPIHSKRRRIVEVEVENLTLTDSDISTYLRDLQVSKVTLINVHITIQGFVMLLGNHNVDHIAYKNERLERDTKEIDYDNLQEQRAFLQEQFLNNAEDLNADFVTLYRQKNDVE